MTSISDLISSFSDEEIYGTDQEQEKLDEIEYNIQSENSSLLNEFDEDMGQRKTQKKLNQELEKKEDGKRKTAILIDGSNFLFRYVCGIEKLFNEKKFGRENVNGIYGMIQKILGHLKNKCDYLYVCWEGGAQERKDLYKLYKANRDEKPENYKYQCKLLHKFLGFLKIPSVFVTGYEADDVIGTLAKKIDEQENGNVDIYIHSADKDFSQLLKENVYLFKPHKKTIYTKKDFENEHGFEVKYFIDYLSLIGDISDNIPGLYGTGKVGAKKIIQKYGTIENLYKNAKEAIELKMIPKRSLEDFVKKETFQRLLLNKKLITLFDIEQLKPKKIQDFGINYQDMKTIIVEKLEFVNFFMLIDDIFTY